jgi:DNA-binding PucR family transcriptional regulator
MHVEGRSVAVGAVTRGRGDTVEVPHAAALLEFAEAVVQRDAQRTAAARGVLLAALGAAGMVDAAATVAAFHGFVRIADTIGIPYVNAAFGQDLPELRAEAGIDAFYRLRG